MNGELGRMEARRRMTTQTSLFFLAIVLASPLFAQEGTPDSLEIIGEESGTERGLPSGQILHFAEVNTPHPFQDIHRIDIRLRDDSPDDGVGGAALFFEEIIVTTKGGAKISNRRRLVNDDGTESSIWEYYPILEGGFRREGFLAADGQEIMTLSYQFDSPEYLATLGPSVSEIEAVEFYLLLANDYRLDVSVEGVWVATLGSPGNVQDGSNQAFIHIRIAEKAIGDVSVLKAVSWGQIKYSTH